MDIFNLFAGTDKPFEFDANSNRFKKEVARTGVYTDRHGKKVTITREYFDELIKNFKPGDDIPVPNGHDGMKDVKANTGFVVALSRDGDSLIAELEIKDPEAAQKIRNKTIKGVSIGVQLSETLGRVLNHIALTLTPAIPNLADFVALEKCSVEMFEFEKEIDLTDVTLRITRLEARI